MQGLYEEFPRYFKLLENLLYFSSKIKSFLNFDSINELLSVLLHDDSGQDKANNFGELFSIVFFKYWTMQSSQNLWEQLGISSNLSRVQKQIPQVSAFASN